MQFETVVEAPERRGEMPAGGGLSRKVLGPSRPAFVRVAGLVAWRWSAQGQAVHHDRTRNHSVRAAGKTATTSPDGAAISFIAHSARDNDSGR